MRKCLCIAGLVAALGAEPAMAGDTVDWLFFQNARSMQFDGTDMILDEIAPVVIAFADRPARIALSIPVEGLAALWSKPENGFGSDPPNAAVSLTAGNQKIYDVVVELSEPRLDGTTLRYAVKVIRGELPPVATDVVVFIDAYPTPVNRQITDSVSAPNVEVLGEAPASAMSNLYDATNQALTDAAASAQVQ